MPRSPQITYDGQNVTKENKVSICYAGLVDFLERMWAHQLGEDAEQCAEQPDRKL